DGSTPDPVNVLKSVHRPLGSTITLGYSRAGNLVRTDVHPAIDMPANKYAMSSVDIDDNFGNHYQVTIRYDLTGFHDRVEREDYGFAKVVTTREDQSTVEDDYFNHDFYRKHLPSTTARRDANGNLFTAEAITYAVPDTTSLPAVYGSFFPAKASETT